MRIRNQLGIEWFVWWESYHNFKLIDLFINLVTEINLTLFLFIICVIDSVETQIILSVLVMVHCQVK